MKNKNLCYDILNALNEKEIIKHSFTWEKVNGGKIKVIDESNYQVIFDLQNSVMMNCEYDINSDAEKKTTKDRLHHYSNYVALIKDDKSIIQLWGKANRGDVIIEFRKHLYDVLECDKLKTFTECKHEMYKGKEQNRLCVVDNVNDAVKIIKKFLERLESKTQGKTSASEKTQASEKAN